MLVTFVLFGHWMEMKSRKGTSDSLRALFDIVPPTATVIRDGREEDVPTAEIVVGDEVRLAEAVAQLKAAGLEVAMISGDNQRTADAVASQLDIDRVFADVLPEDKVDYGRRDGCRDRDRAGRAHALRPH